MNIDLGSEHL